MTPHHLHSPHARGTCQVRGSGRRRIASKIPRNSGICSVKWDHWRVAAHLPRLFGLVGSWIRSHRMLWVFSIPSRGKGNPILYVYDVSLGSTNLRIRSQGTWSCAAQRRPMDDLHNLSRRWRRSQMVVRSLGELISRFRATTTSSPQGEDFYDLHMHIEPSNYGSRGEI